MMSTQQLILAGKHIILWCKQCKKPTIHATITKDSWTKKFRKLKQPPKSSYPPRQYKRQCEECGNIATF